MTSTATTERGARLLLRHPAHVPPVLLRRPDELRSWSERCRAAGLEIGIVPTMGALHEGHLTLVRRALRECDRVVVSVFVNPAQFAPGDDLERYPRRLDDDLHVLRQERVAAVFAPTAEAMYPPSATTRLSVGPPLTTRLEGEVRPGHFDGVALVVAKLLIAGRPDRAYFGIKDAQQLAVVRRLVADLDLGVEVVACPTVRDVDGLALSSRNCYLAPADRRRALLLPAALAAAAADFARGERRCAHLREAALRVLASGEMPVDYVAIVHPNTFEELAEAREGCVLAGAGRIGDVRLIDALTLGVDAPPAVTGAVGK
jgi:pantoate--beta-alanine ligase